jgi:hypothetical protein
LLHSAWWSYTVVNENEVVFAEKLYFIPLFVRPGSVLERKERKEPALHYKNILVPEGCLKGGIWDGQPPPPKKKKNLPFT